MRHLRECRCPRQSLPRVGKVASGASRIGQWRYEKERGDRLKQAIYEHPSAVTQPAFPNGEGKEEAASPPKKEANPASLRSAAPSKGRGSRGHSLLPMEGGAPKGRRLDGGSGMKKDRERSSQVRRLREHPIHRCAVPLPRGRRLRRYENAAFLALSERIHAYVEKRITTDKAFPAWGRWRAKRAG